MEETPQQPQEKKIRHDIENQPYLEKSHENNLKLAIGIYKRSFGIEPTTTEIIKMSYIIQDVLRDTDKRKKELENSSAMERLASGPDPFEGLAHRILDELYGVTIEELNNLFPHSENEDEDEKNKELKKKYFRIK